MEGEVIEELEQLLCSRFLAGAARIQTGAMQFARGEGAHKMQQFDGCVARVKLGAV